MTNEINTLELRKRFESDSKARLLNVWRTVPYLDISGVIDRFNLHGIPMCLDKKITSPSGSSPETFIEVAQFADAQDDFTRIILQSSCLFAPIAQAYGLPLWLDQDVDGIQYPYYEELQRAGNRATDVQRARNERAG